MAINAASLMSVYEGWDGYQVSLVRAIAPLSIEQLAYRPALHLRSVGEIASHISLGRIEWFQRMHAPGSAEVAEEAAAWEPEEAVVEHAAELVRRLEASWQMIEKTLTQWSVADLAQTFRHSYQGKTYAVSHQWIIWRIMAHDIHHGG
ncbi:MAG TPA: DinB family protein, partial [Ktedonobacteraceae bacterium]